MTYISIVLSGVKYLLTPQEAANLRDALDYALRRVSEQRTEAATASEITITPNQYGGRDIVWTRPGVKS